MDKALEAAKTAVGGTAKLASAIGGISSQAISQWKRVPGDRVLDVERITGISRHDLRPDIFGVSPLPSTARRASKQGEAA